MMLRSTIMAVALFATMGASAATKTPIAEGKSVLTMRVDCEITINSEGTVTSYQLFTELEPQIQELLVKAIPGWRFSPLTVDGKPAAARSPMRITLAATAVESGYQVRVDNVVFRPETAEPSVVPKSQEGQAGGTLHVIERADERNAPQRQYVQIKRKRVVPPIYPQGIMQAGIEGLVLLNILLRPDGTVANVFASQSSLLDVEGKAGVLDRARVEFEKNAVAGARNWTFTVKAESPSSLRADDLTVRIPIEYKLHPADPRHLVAANAPGKWRHEFRGPNMPVPWLAGEDGQQMVGVSDLDGGELMTGTPRLKLADRSVIGSVL